ncbi:trehalose phosphorylase, partial [Tuber brumale]
GGTPLQIQHGKSGYPAEVGDTDPVFNHLFNLYISHDIYTRTRENVKASVTNEVVTTGKAARWLSLAAKLAGGQVLKGSAR